WILYGRELDILINGNHPLYGNFAVDILTTLKWTAIPPQNHEAFFPFSRRVRSLRWLILLHR
ncbi:hypothetical protein PN470_19720, partial [Microcystis sp. CS-574]|uniref:hypothetical protein n=1 Tax=Microcystis sp. CS-574 TaxID=3021718 RepID=UPI0023315A38